MKTGQEAAMMREADDLTPQYVHELLECPGMEEEEKMLLLGIMTMRAPWDTDESAAKKEAMVREIQEKKAIRQWRKLKLWKWP